MQRRVDFEFVFRQPRFTSVGCADGHHSDDVENGKRSDIDRNFRGREVYNDGGWEECDVVGCRVVSTNGDVENEV